jgi:hypothetical protein
MTARTAIAAIAYDKMIVKSWDFAFECLVVSTASLALSSKVDILTSYVRVRMRASKKFHAARARTDAQHRTLRGQSKPEGSRGHRGNDWDGKKPAAYRPVGYQ